jgi:hypothetical protein
VRVKRKISAKTQTPLRPWAMSTAVCGSTSLETVTAIENTTSTPEDCWMYCWLHSEYIV